MIREVAFRVSWRLGMFVHERQDEWAIHGSFEVKGLESQDGEAAGWMG